MLGVGDFYALGFSKGVLLMHLMDAFLYIFLFCFKPILLIDLVFSYATPKACIPRVHRKESAKLARVVHLLR